MWNPLKKSRDRAAQARAAEHKAFLDALQAVVGIANAHAEANRALSEVLHEWLGMFRTPGTPSRWVNDDVSELIQQDERIRDLKDHGYPVEMDAAGQAMWVAEQMNRVDRG